MKKNLIIIFVGMLFPVCTNAQFSKLMSEYHDKECVTVTQLDKNLYGLYKKNNLPPDAEKMLQQLDEVNFLNLNLNLCNPAIETKITAQFKAILDNPDKYKLIKSHSDDIKKQLIYSRAKNDKVTDLVIWNRTPTRLDIIELKGDIQLDQIASLSKALNIKGLSSLSALSPDNDSYNAYKHSNDYSGNFNDEMERMSRDMQKMAEEIKNQFAGADFGNFMNDMFGTLGESFDKMGNMFDQYGDAVNIMSNSVQVTEENGKTKIKIDSKNTDMVYIIDGVEVPKDNIQMPDQIRNVSVIHSKEDIKKSYLFITSKNKIGEFVSYKDGVLTFNYNKQEYKYNLGKAKEPLLIIDGELSDNFTIDPSAILQIRPLGKAEKEAARYKSAEILVNTK